MARISQDKFLCISALLASSGLQPRPSTLPPGWRRLSPPPLPPSSKSVKSYQLQERRKACWVSEATEGHEKMQKILPSRDTSRIPVLPQIPSSATLPRRPPQQRDSHGRYHPTRINSFPLLLQINSAQLSTSSTCRQHMHPKNLPPSSSETFPIAQILPRIRVMTQISALANTRLDCSANGGGDYGYKKTPNAEQPASNKIA